MLSQYALVALGGALGAMSRFGVEHIPLFDDDKYYYTVVINVSGCLVMGVLWALMSHFATWRGWELLILTGYLGGYTTYSAFCLDAMLQLQSGKLLLTFYYISITIVLGLGGCALGLFGTEKILKLLGHS